MSSSETKLQCYNRSCGQTFDPAQNSSESCLHHPGLPVFHDAYKKWSCCEKKTTDFTEFLNIKGCTRSYHSNIKPAEPPKSASQHKIEERKQIPQPLQTKEVFIRPDANEPLVRISSQVGSSLKPVLEKMKKEFSEAVEKKNEATVKINDPCLNKGCRVVYKGDQSDAETCLYHSGIPVFHEGLKYWSCCVKRTTDFNSFLEQIGCAVGNHKWHKDENDKENIEKCRYDWHQTGNFVVISIYSKCPLPDFSFVEANQVKLHIHITFGDKKWVFDEEILLYGVISVNDCLVTYLGSKVEIKLKKAGQIQLWKSLAAQKDQTVQNSVSVPDIESIKIQDGDHE